jgi:hypothetical protein
MNGVLFPARNVMLTSHMIQIIQTAQKGAIAKSPKPQGLPNITGVSSYTYPSRRVRFQIIIHKLKDAFPFI